MSYEDNVIAGERFDNGRCIQCGVWCGNHTRLWGFCASHLLNQRYVLKKVLKSLVV